MTAAERPQRSILARLNRAIPFIILAIAGAIIAALWLWPGMQLDSRAPNTLFTVLAAAAWLWLWAVTLSGFRWYVRVPILLAGVAVGGGFLALAISGLLIFDGDMIPFLRSPFENHSAVVEEHRRHQESEPVAAVELTVRPTDWAEFRGPRRDGVVIEGPTLARDWSARPPRLVWKQPCGEGWSSFAIVGNLLVTLEQRRDHEAIVAYDAGSGRELWKHEYPARFWEPLGGLGPRSTPTVSEGEVFALGATGQLVCLDARTGSLKWAVDILEGGTNLQWGMAGSPLVVDGKVIVNPGYQASPERNRAVVAYDRATGREVWATPGSKAGYSSPMLATLAGRRQIVLFDGGRVGGYDVATGKNLWSFPWNRTREDINVAQPLILDGDRVFISSGYNIGCAMLKIESSDDGFQVSSLWVKDNQPLRCKFTGPVEYEGNLYGLDDGILACIDAATGKLNWRDGRYGHGQLVRWRDLLVILDQRGNLVLVEATPSAHRELGKVRAIKAERTWNVPVLADGFVFVRNDREMACFDLRE